MSISSKKDLIEEIAEALTMDTSEETPFLDLTEQEILPYPENIMDDDFDINCMDLCLSAEELKEARTHQLIKIETLPSYIEYNLMEDFAEQHDNQRLFHALRGRHPFAAFRNAVDTEGLLDEWYAVKNKFHNEKAEGWLEKNGIDVIDGKIVQINK
ncbi:MAG: UPF0158 family protein [Lentisphaeria bacterium]|nr:hypothetical protein [Victivallales bacterium]MBR6057077.1 hypothetical protein [Victivallales bacterium]MCR4572471.1 UPF0158 family protein [Lentisphaeria bacterium]